jgi:hypothetical protein
LAHILLGKPVSTFPGYALPDHPACESQDGAKLLLRLAWQSKER